MKQRLKPRETRIEVIGGGGKGRAWEKVMSFFSLPFLGCVAFVLAVVWNIYQKNYQEDHLFLFFFSKSVFYGF